MDLIKINKFLISVEDKIDRYVIRLFVSDTRDAYVGELMVNDLVNGAQHLEIHPEEYICESIRAIKTENGQSDFVYSFKDNTFSWTKKIEGCFFQIYFGKVKMIKSDKVFLELMCFNLVNNYLRY